MPTRDELRAQFLSVARDAARTRSFNFTTDAENELRSLVETGLDRMTSAEMNSPSDVERAAQSYRRLAEAAVVASRNLLLTESISGTAVSRARASICPLWPIC